MITLYGYSFEIYQVVLLVYVTGYGLTLGVKSTFARFVSLFGGSYNQSTLGMLLDSLWYGSLFVLVGTLV